MTTDLNNTSAGKETPLFETGLNFCQIKELMTHMKKEGVTHFEMGEGKTCLSMTREKEVVYVPTSSDGRISYGGPAFDMSPVSAEQETVIEEIQRGCVVTSPVVGVFYDSPAPDQEPYVTLGSYVEKGDVLCIIEAMKLMNEVTSPVSGWVKEILVKKASRVEFGHKLYIIDPGQMEEEDHE